MGQGDYSITEFAHRLAQAEARYGKEMLEIIECFTNSRVDLPVKKLEDLSRARMKCARHLRKMDVKKEEYINLWKLCNIYSVTAVDVDDAMREIRNSLRKRMKAKEISRDVSTFRRLIDEYRPAKKASSADHQQEIYDKPNTKEKQRWLELNVFGRKKEEKKDHSNDDYSRKSKLAAKTGHPDHNNTLKISVPAVDSHSKAPPAAAPPPIPNCDYTPGVYDSPMIPPLGFRLPAPPPYPPPSITSARKYQIPRVAETPLFLNGESYDEVWTIPTFDDEKPALAKGKGGHPDKIVVPPEPKSPAVFDSSEFLKQLIPPTGNVQLMEGVKSASTAGNAQTLPRQISPSTMYKPTAPPRPSAPRARNPSTSPSSQTSAKSATVDGEPRSRDHSTAMLSHTMIEILPNPEGGTLSRVRRPEHEAEYSTLDRRGILAKRHSIKIDTNSIHPINPADRRLDSSYLLTVPGSDYSIVVNHL